MVMDRPGAGVLESLPDGLPADVGAEPFLEAQGICKSYPGVQALKDVGITIRRGEVHALVGENGAGKSTLVNVLAGVVKPDAGVIRVRGRVVKIESPKQAAECGIAVVHQELSLFANLDVATNLYLTTLDEGSAFVVRDRRLRAEARAILDQVGLCHISPTRRLGALTLAEQQLVEIGRALVKDVDLLVLDEPTSSLAEREIETLFRIIRDLKSRGISVIFVSHRLEEVFLICDRVTVIRDGMHVETTDTGSVTHAELVRLILGRQLSEMYQAPESREFGEELLPPKLSDVSFELRRGEILGIGGLLGSGRTELVRAIFGLAKLEAGAFYLRSRQTRIGSPDQAIRMGIGYITEDRHREGLVLEKPVKDNVVMASLRAVATTLGWVLPSREMAAAKRQRESLNIVTPSLARKVKFLSGGNQQKVVLGKWLETGPEIFLLDDPTRGIDVGTKAEFYRIIQGLAGKGAGIILISSELQELVAICHRILVLRTGKFVGEFVGKEINAADILMAMTGGR